MYAQKRELSILNRAAWIDVEGQETACPSVAAPGDDKQERNAWYSASSRILKHCSPITPKWGDRAGSREHANS
jgi:hypothetical protein